jgi:hypothetical protein
MNKSRASLALIAALALLTGLLAACKDTALPPVFYTLENERELIDDRGMPDEANVFRVVHDPASDRLFAAAGPVYWRDVVDGHWQRIAPPFADALCNHIEYFSAAAPTARIAAWFFNSQHVNENGLYTLDPAGNPPAGWSPVTIPVLTKPTVDLLKEVNSLLFVSFKHGDNPDFLYTLYSVDGSYAFTPASLSGVPEKIIDVEYDTSDYWVATMPNASSEWLYTGALGTLTADAGPPGMVVTTGRPPGALFYLSGDNDLYLSSENGKVFFRHLGVWSSWTGDPVQVDSKNVRFTSFVKADGANIFVGTKGQGYYKFVAGTVASDADLTRRPDYNITALYNGAVQGFLAVPDPPAAPDTLFACTYGSGLWRAEYDDESSEVWPWVQE